MYQGFSLNLGKRSKTIIIGSLLIPCEVYNIFEASRALAKIVSSLKSKLRIKLRLPKYLIHTIGSEPVIVKLLKIVIVKGTWAILTLHSSLAFGSSQFLIMVKSDLIIIISRLLTSLFTTKPEFTSTSKVE